MFSAVLKEVTGVLSRRFLMTVFFPSLIFWGLLIVLIVSTQGDVLQTAETWNKQEPFLKTLQIIGLIVWVTFFANMVSSQLPAILRFYEGYWNFPLGRYFKAIGKKRHQKYLQQLTEKLDKDPRCYEKIYLTYPLPTQSEQVMPTRLGNILKNAELYPKDRYRIDAVLIWPRLYYLLPERFIQAFAEARGALDFMLVISSLSGAFALISAGYLLYVRAPVQLFLICIPGGLLIAWLAYESAIDSALLYAQQIKVAFDLYRNDLLKQMNMLLPATPAEEKERWNEVVQFLYRNVRGLWTYREET